MTLWRLLLVAAIPGALICRAASADPVADFFIGKTVTVAVGTSAGGSYDAYARLLARHFGAHVPGNPTVATRNMPT